MHVDGEVVSWDLLPTLGVNPELGRGFTADEEKQGTRVVLISHALWVEQFGADPSVLGRSIKLSGDSYTVIGVMPASFRFPVTAPQNGVWTTLAVDDDPTDPHPMTKSRGAHFLSTIGRMKPGVTVAQVDQDLKHIAGNLAKQYPNSNARHDSAAVQTELAALIGDTRTALTVVLGAVALVLLIACANIANLLLARMRERQREIAVRAALGADRKRIIRQLLVESLALSTIGGLAGCALAFAATPAMLALIGDSVPRAANAGVDLRVLCFAIVLSFVAGLIFGIVPAVTASKTDLVTTFKEGGRTETSHRDWLRSSLIVGQVALGLVLTAGAGLLITSFMNSAAYRARFQSRPSADVFLRIARCTIQAEAARVLSRLLREGARNSGRAIGRRRHGSADDQRSDNHHVRGPGASRTRSATALRGPHSGLAGVFRHHANPGAGRTRLF